MATPRFELPKDPAALVEATNALEAAAKSRRRSLRVGWRYDFQWLKGIRNFRVFWGTGEVQASYQNFKGELKLRYEDVLKKRQREIGRLMQMDVRPAVTRKGLGIDALRKASVGQVVLDHITGNLNLEAIKGHLIEDICDFGMAGLGVWVQQTIHLGASPMIEVIPPWELTPLPVEPTRNYDVRGICRDRWVTLDWLKSKESLKLPGEKEQQKLQIREVQPGVRLPGDNDPSDNPMASEGGSPPVEPSGGDGNTKKPHLTKWVYLREYWIEGEEGRVCRYIVKVGDWIALDLADEKLLGKKTEYPVMPIATARYFNTGFYGRSFVSPLIPLNRQMERMAANLFQNVADLDLYGLRMIPSTLGIKKEALNNMGRNRYLIYEPDYAAWQIKPDTLTPHNMGDFPGKILERSHLMMDRLSGESELFQGQAPGRIDNSRSLGILYETSSIPMIPVTASIGNAFSQIYKAMLQEALNILQDNPEGGNAKAIKLAGLDDAIAGVVVDPKSGTLTLGDKNPLPRPDEVIIDIRERMPRFAEKSKMELDESLVAKKIDLIDYLMVCLKKNIDAPLGNEQIVQAIRCAWLENMVLFGDGETPGSIEQNDVSDLHKVHRRVHLDFMARPEWKLASVAVKTKFVKHVNWHSSQLGEWAELLPDPGTISQLPPELAQGLMMGAPQGPMPGGGPGGGPPVAAPMGAPPGMPMMETPG